LPPDEFIAWASRPTRFVPKPRPNAAICAAAACALSSLKPKPALPVPTSVAVYVIGVNGTRIPEQTAGRTVDAQHQVLQRDAVGFHVARFDGIENDAQVRRGSDAELAERAGQGLRGAGLGVAGDDVAAGTVGDLALFVRVILDRQDGIDRAEPGAVEIDRTRGNQRRLARPRCEKAACQRQSADQPAKWCFHDGLAFRM
jgi:hypothetical protein